MDAFFASVEQRDNPELRGKPVAVGGSADRGVVAAASYEARVFGIRSAMPSKTAKRLCPNLVFTKPRFEVYKQVSKQIREIFAEYTSLIEPLSLDEAYLDVTDNLKGVSTATEIAQEIRAKIFSRTGLTASAGISFNKFLAKTASDINKPNGQCVIKPSQAEAFVETLPIKKFYGIGNVTTERMHSLGIFSGKELKEQSLEFLVKNFGKAGHYFHEIARGEDKRNVEPHRENKSIGVENTYNEDLHLTSEIVGQIKSLCEQMLVRAEKSKVYGNTLTLKIKYTDFEQVTRSKTSNLGFKNKGNVEYIAIKLFDSLLPLTKDIRLIGVAISNLNFIEKLAGQQLTLEL